MKAPRLAGGSLRVPGMLGDLGGGSPPASLMEAKASEAQGQHREVLSGGSVEQRCEPTDRNWISRREGRTSWREATKSISIKGRKRKFSGCAPKVVELTPGGLLCCPQMRDRWNRKVP